MIKHYNVCSISISISDYLITSKNECWKKYLTDQIVNKEFVIDVLMLNKEKYNFDSFGTSYSILTDHIYRLNHETMLIDKDWKNGYILQPFNMEDASAFITMVFMTHAVRRHMLQIHCSIVEYKGVGILFLGPSGIGKTTQAERWAEFKDALIINGDIGYVEDTGNGFLAWGTPWHGSSPYCVNTSVPVVAMVVLKQSSENKLRRLQGFEMVTEVSGSVFYPTWLEDGMELCTATLNDLLTSVPVYLLENKADEEAVNLLADELGLS